MDAELPILIVGDIDRQEFRATAEWLSHHDARTTADVPGAMAVIHDGFAPALIVVAQPWPGRFSSREIDELRRAAPLARIIGLLGTWLEGETRTGRPWPATLRTYWHQASIRLARELERFETHCAPVWTLPATANDDERVLSGYGAVDSASSIDDGGTARGLIAIYARQRETAETLADACAAGGWRTVWLRDLNIATPLVVNAVVCDFHVHCVARCEKIAAIKAATCHAPIIALLGFPRIDDAQSWHEAGVSAVVSKPFLSGDLLWQLDRLLQPAAAI